MTNVIIKFKNTIAKANTDFLESLGADINHTFPSINAVSANVDINKIGLIKSDPAVEYVEIDHEAQTLAYISHQPKDIADALAAGQITPWGVQKIKSPEVWPEGYKGAGVKVCILDTGIDYNHEDLKSNYKGGYNFVANNSDPFDDMGHGTHCAGIVAALDNNVGVIGVAPESSLYAVKVLDKNGSGSYSNIMAGIQWCMDNGIQIISMSFGGTSYSQALKDICDEAYNRGILLVAAAGNNGDGGDTITYPARYDSVIAVVATDANDSRASFSSMGPEAEIAGPGVSIPSTVPIGTCKYCDPTGYRNLSGTSMACPHITGVAALVMNKYPGSKNTEVREILDKAVVDLGQTGRDVYYGYGRTDAKAAVDQTPPPQTRYRCTGAPDYLCVEDPNGKYGSLQECQDACKQPPPEKKYKCSGSPDYQCIEDANGPYASLEECQAACKQPPPAKRYRCTGAPNYQCVEDPDGEFASLDECMAKCQAPPPPPSGRYDIHPVGTLGIMIVKTSRGNYNSNQACAAVCKMLKELG